MSDNGQSSFRIDWFDGTVIEERRSNTPEETTEPSTSSFPQQKYYEKKLMGFKRLLELSNQEATSLTLQLSERSSFWDLLNTELKEDYIILIVKVLSKLYANIISGQKSITLKKLLETRFLQSKFLNVLSDYILRLPAVRIVEKRMNMHFWDDVESFYSYIITVCDGICIIHSGDNMIKVKSLLEAIRTSIDGLMSEHKEQFSETIFNQMDELEEKIFEFNNKAPPSEAQVQNYKKSVNEHKSDFRTLNIFPTYNDLLNKTSCKIEPNIVNGAYSSVEHYLDVQFKLLREDCFGPLREGIMKYMENPMKKQFENIRVHPKVRIIKTYASNNKVGHLVDIAWRQRQSQNTVDSKKYATSKQLMFGSLLLFTNDNFKTIICATVLDSNLNLLHEGYLAVTFHSPVSKNIFSEAYLMVESEVFFEPYHGVLKVLQEFDKNFIPMQRYIVQVQPETSKPSYLSQDTVYNISTTNGKEVSINVLKTEMWPHCEELGLDQSQMDAYKLALIREFAVIQGPPGTGKTFLGIQIAKTLLQNLSLEGTPMLLISYTNHALDQFLEGILKITKNILRLGSQSKNESIQPYTLSNLRIKNKSKFSHLYTNKRLQLEHIFKEMAGVQSEIEKCENEILTYKTIKLYMKSESNLNTNNSNDDPILKWLFDDEKSVPKNDVIDDWEEIDERINIDEDSIHIESCFSDKWALKEIEAMLNSLKHVKDITADESERTKLTDKFQHSIDKIHKRLDTYKRYLKQYQNGILQPDTQENIDLHSLSVTDRWRLYFRAVDAIKRKLLHNMDDLFLKHEQCNQELDETATLVDAELIKTARVVGVTTTTAARRRDLLQALKSPIVIVEEAAEVFEAHIVASLTQYCQHLILIGDHKQLRPTASHYKLARECNLEISLFERMIINGVHATTLTVQRRMRPDFVELIVPTIYDQLTNHQTVQSYSNVRGIKKNLFFLTNDVYEDEMYENTWSHRNTFEARWCVALADYLRRMDYNHKDVTILATYAGQASLIKELSNKYELLQNVKITVVDNYQGEESKIVILSLVRSNRDGKIGFLAAQNRICVALSRAKEGFYLFGNMNILKDASPIWRNINSTLASQNAIGSFLTILCRHHPCNEINVHCVEDFKDCCSGGCLKICNNK